MSDSQIDDFASIQVLTMEYSYSCLNGVIIHSLTHGKIRLHTINLLLDHLGKELEDRRPSMHMHAMRNEYVIRVGIDELVSLTDPSICCSLPQSISDPVD